MKITPGFQVGKLTVTGPTEERKNGYTVWECRCDCGNTVNLDTRALQRGAIRDCGCASVVKPGQRDITGERFGMLTAIEPTAERRNSGSTVWLCRCDCGGEVCASLHQLEAGYRKSCGCLSHPPLKDWIGKRFGKLTVTEYVGKIRGLNQWRCVCDCGREIVAGQTRLQSGMTENCGCELTNAQREGLKLVSGTSVAILEKGLDHLRSNNTSGFTGVYYQKHTGKWQAKIEFRGKRYNLGSYTDKQDAVKARRRGEEMHADFIRWYYEEYIPAMDGNRKRVAAT